MEYEMENDDFVELVDDPDIHLIAHHGVDLDELIDNFELEMNISMDGSDESGVEDFDIRNNFENWRGELQQIRGEPEYGWRNLPISSDPPRTNDEIFTSIETQVIKESPTLRLFLAGEHGNLMGLQEALESGAEPDHHGSRYPQNILKVRMKKIGLNKHIYQNVHDKIQDKSAEAIDSICVQLIKTCPTLLDMTILNEMIQKEMTGMFKFTLKHIDSHSLWRQVFQLEKNDFLTQLFKENFIDKAVDDSSMLFLPILASYGFTVSTKCKLVYNLQGAYDEETKWINLFDKFVQSIIYKMERGFRQGWEDINTFKRERLMDRTLVSRIQFGYSMIFSNLCDYGINLRQEISCFDEHGDWGIAKTFPNYLLTHLLHLNKKQISSDFRHFRSNGLLMNVLHDLLGVCANKRVGLFLDMNDRLLSEFVALQCFTNGVTQKSKNNIILELVHRWKRQKNQDEEDWLFQKTLLDSKGRKAFSSRGRARNRARLSSSSSQYSLVSNPHTV